MIEGGSLILAAAAIYLFECVVAVPRTAVAFKSRLGRRMRPAMGDGLPGLPSVGWAMAFPLPPLGRVLICPRRPACPPLGADPAALDRTIEHAFDVEAIRRTLEKHRRRTAPLVLSCNLAWSWTFAVAPAAMALLGLATVWRPLLAGLIALTGWTTVELWLVLHELRKEQTAERWFAAATHLMAPPVAIRAFDRVDRDLVAGRHPVAVAVAVCSHDVARALAERELREARHPLPAEGPGDSRGDTAPDAPGRRWLEALERCIERSLGVAPDELLRAPAPEAPDSGLYCPRCRSQYVAGTAGCADCPGLDLLPLAGP